LAGRSQFAATGGCRRGFLGIPATGRTVEYASHEFYRAANGFIAEEWICSDMTTLLRQLG
jgi:predicted ester cyclase